MPGSERNRQVRRKRKNLELKPEFLRYRCNSVFELIGRDAGAVKFTRQLRNKKGFGAYRADFFLEPVLFDAAAAGAGAAAAFAIDFAKRDFLRAALFG